MSCRREVIKDFAMGFLGVKEGSADHHSIIDVYNTIRPLPRNYRVTYNDAWCAAFVSACAKMCGALDIIPAECSCYYMVEGFKKLKCWVENDAYVPETGDIIFYDWKDTGVPVDDIRAPQHVGIVTELGNDGIHVIEGNYHDMVDIRIIKPNGKYIRGYGIPKYISDTIDYTEVVNDVLKGKYGNYPERKTKLEERGYHYRTVQALVNLRIKGTL